MKPKAADSGGVAHTSPHALEPQSAEFPSEFPPKRPDL